MLFIKQPPVKYEVLIITSRRNQNNNVRVYIYSMLFLWYVYGRYYNLNLKVFKVRKEPCIGST